MKIELKNIKHFYELTDETNAFSAKLYVNDIFTAECSDTGKGGCIDIQVVKGKEKLLKEAEEYTKGLPALKTNYGFDLDMHLQLYIGQLVDTDIEEREFKKSVKSLEKNNIIFGKSKREMQYTWFTAEGNKKVPIANMLTSPSAKQMLINRIVDLKKEGNLIFNTNIPEELLGNSDEPKNKSK